MNSAEYIQRQGHERLKGMLIQEGKNIEKTWNIGGYQLIVIYGDGSIFSTCVSGV